MLGDSLTETPSVSFLAVSFGLCTTCMSTMQSYGGFVGARFVLGALEAGIAPGSAYSVSCLWVPPVRLSATLTDHQQLHQKGAGIEDGNPS